jgi:siderophore synthetase component
MSKQRNPNGSGSYKRRKDGRYQWTRTIDGVPQDLYDISLKALQEKVKKIANLPITPNKLKVAEWFDRWLEIYIKPLKKVATFDAPRGKPTRIQRILR